MSSENTPLLPTTTSPHPPRSLLLAATATSLILLLLLVTTTLTLPSPTLHAPVHNSPPPALSLAILGDWGRDGQHSQNAVATALSNLHLTPTAPTHVISAGDNFYDNGVQSVHDQKFNTSFESIYQSHSAHTPWYAILGNHDHLGSVHAQIAYSSRSKRWNMPAEYFQTTFGDVRAIFLDTTPFVRDKYGKRARENGHDWRRQLKWLEGVLASLDPREKILVFGHHNMYTMSVAGHFGDERLRTFVEPLLMRYRKNILAYISGHEHALMHMKPYGDDGFDHILSGAGSKLDDIEEPILEQREHYRNCCAVLPVVKEAIPNGRTAWYARKHGFFQFRYDGTTVYISAIGEDGTVLYDYSRRVSTN